MKLRHLQQRGLAVVLDPAGAILSIGFKELHQLLMVHQLSVLSHFIGSRYFFTHLLRKSQYRRKDLIFSHSGFYQVDLLASQRVVRI